MNPETVAAGTSRDGQYDGDIHPRPRQLVIFRPPSRHTYGFAGGGSDYDLPILELRTLLGSATACDDRGVVRFVPVETSSRRTRLREEGNMTGMHRSKSKNHSKKKGAKQHPHRVQSLYWMERNEKINSDDIAAAASRAILTHATFSIQESVSFSKEDWSGSAPTDSNNAGNNSSSEILECMEVIDMSDPNMSRDARSGLIKRVSRLIEKENPELRLRLQKHFSTKSSCGMQSILIHHCTDPVQQQRHGDATGHHPKQKRSHHLHFGWRTSVGPVGTRGSPSQTLQRTH